MFSVIREIQTAFFMGRQKLKEMPNDLVKKGVYSIWDMQQQIREAHGKKNYFN